MFFTGVLLYVREGVVGSLGEGTRFVQSLTLCLSSGGHAVVCDGSQSGDVAHTDVWLDENAAYEVGTVGLWIRPTF